MNLLCYVVRYFQSIGEFAHCSFQYALGRKLPLYMRSIFCPIFSRRDHLEIGLFEEYFVPARVRATHTIRVFLCCSVNVHVD